jgi:hypothetical protein
MLYDINSEYQHVSANSSKSRFPRGIKVLMGVCTLLGSKYVMMGSDSKLILQCSRSAISGNIQWTTVLPVRVSSLLSPSRKYGNPCLRQHSSAVDALI